MKEGHKRNNLRSARNSTVVTDDIEFKAQDLFDFTAQDDTGPCGKARSVINIGAADSKRTGG